MQSFKSLKVWRKAHEVTLEIYRLTARFPKDEKFGLTAQVRRSAASVGANIAEGCGRGSDPDFARFLQIAMGSASETEYHLLLARDLGFVEAEAHASAESDVEEVKRMLTALIRRLSSARR